MEFNSLFFMMIFLPLFVFLMLAVKNIKLSNGLLMIFSLLFYFFADSAHFILLLLMILLTYFAGLLVRNRLTYFLYLLVVVGILAFFKYGSYLSDSIKEFLNSFNYALLVMPAGISFYTFTSIAYVSDVYYQKIPREKSLFKIACFIAYFPTIVSGPILRFQPFENYLKDRTVSFDSIAEGLRRFIWGLFKKVVIADQLALLCNVIFADSVLLSLPLAVLGAIGFMLQLYYDFSAYSDMAIAISVMIGFKVEENFNDPYLAENIQQFWRRWHISLSSWFRDYVYIPLGGNRVGIWGWLFNTLFVWFLTGIWHGSSFNYLLWGLYNGVLLILYRFVFKRWKLPKFLMWLFTQALVCVGFVIFRCNSWFMLKQFIKACLLRGYPFDWLYLKKLDIVYLWVYLFLAVVLLFPKVRALFSKKMGPVVYDLLLIGLLSVSIFYIVSGSYSSFIYVGF